MMSKIRKSEETKQAEILAALKEIFIKCQTGTRFILKSEMHGIAVAHAITAINKLGFIKKVEKGNGETLHKWLGEAPAIMATKVYAKLLELLKEYKENEKQIQVPAQVEKPQLLLLTDNTTPQLLYGSDPANANDRNPSNAVLLNGHEVTVNLLQRLLEIQTDTNEKITQLYNSLK